LTTEPLHWRLVRSQSLSHLAHLLPCTRTPPSLHVTPQFFEVITRFSGYFVVAKHHIEPMLALFLGPQGIGNPFVQVRRRACYLFSVVFGRDAHLRKLMAVFVDEIINVLEPILAPSHDKVLIWLLRIPSFLMIFMFNTLSKWDSRRACPSTTCYFCTRAFPGSSPRNPPQTRPSECGVSSTHCCRSSTVF